MSEQELLEYAARPAGIDGRYFKSDNPIHTGIYRAGHDYYWNPLISNSEALQLAAKIRIDIYYEKQHSGHPWSVVADSCFTETDENQTMEEATRRAIVRAAASLGRSMEAAPSTPPIEPGQKEGS